MMFTTPFVLTLMLGSISAPLERCGTLNAPAIREASGLVASRRHPGIFWVHNDSGNLPALYAVKRDGTLVREYLVGVPNIDWEDVAVDDDGRLYLGDVGNNDGRLPIRTIHRLVEPDPSQPSQGPLTVESSWSYKFPARGRFDAESLVVDRGGAVLVAKTFDRTEAELFTIPLDAPAPLWKPVLPVSAGRLPRFQEPATGADLSRDGLWLAVCAVDVARVYRRARRDRAWELVATVRYEADDVESIAWDGADLILAGENRALYRIPERRWRKGRSEVGPPSAPRSPSPSR